MANKDIRRPSKPVAALEADAPEDGGDCPAGDGIRWIPGFYDYYQINRGDEDHSPEESESGRAGELTGRHEGLHSPWGTIWSIATATGWSLDYILWQVSWGNLMMMIADAPRYITGKKLKRGKDIESEKDIMEAFF